MSLTTQRCLQETPVRVRGLIFSYLGGEERMLVISGRGGLSVSSSSAGPSGCCAAHWLTGSALSRHRKQSDVASIQIYEEGSDMQHFRNRNERRFVFIWQCTLAASQGDPHAGFGVIVETCPQVSERSSGLWREVQVSQVRRLHLKRCHIQNRVLTETTFNLINCSLRKLVLPVPFKSRQASRQRDRCLGGQTGR